MIAKPMNTSPPIKRTMLIIAVGNPAADAPCGHTQTVEAAAPRPDEHAGCHTPPHGFRPFRCRVSDGTRQNCDRITKWGHSPECPIVWLPAGGRGHVAGWISDGDERLSRAGMEVPDGIGADSADEGHA